MAPFRSYNARVATVLSIIALTVAAFLTVWTFQSSKDATDSSAQARGLADQVADACAKGGITAAQLGPACQKAAEVQSSPVPTPPVDDVRQAAKDAVADYCDAHQQCRGADGSSPDVDGIVQRVLDRINIPDPIAGPAGADAVVDYPKIVASVIAQLPAPIPGPKGDQGPAGAAGVQGRDGEPGRGIVSRQYLIADGACVERTVYTAAPTQVDTPVGLANCLP